ncbi:MAG: YbaB/EbfC family nucleoid-associated protein [Natronosporangium sp.]
MRPERDTRLEEILKASRRGVAKARAVQRDVARVEVTATSRDRTVAVTVTALGRAIEVRLDPDALRDLAADELEKLILHTLQAAQDAAAAELRRRVRADAQATAVRQCPGPAALRGR